MRHIVRHSILVVLLLVVMVMSIFPPEENLRLGKDLAGGVSLVYTVDIKPSDPPEVVDRTIEVLKKRVNPNGLFEISFVKQGRDRIEVAMPLPSEAVKARRAQFEAELAKFNAYVIDTDGLERALRLSGRERVSAIKALMTSPALEELLAPLVEKAPKVDSTKAVYERAASVAQGIVPDAAGPAEERLAKLLDEAAEAQLALEEEKQRLLGMVVTVDEIRAALELTNKGLRVADKTVKKKYLELPSQQDKALEGIRARVADIAGADEQIDKIIAAKESYNKIRKGLDDPSDLIRLLQGAGVLTFRIAANPGELPDEARLRREVRDRGPGGVQSTTAAWFAINSLENWYDNVDEFRAMSADPAGYLSSRYGLVAEERDGEYYVLLKDEPGSRLTAAEGKWSLESAFPTSDQLGRAAVGFRMDPAGSTLMGELTGNNVGRSMAVVLDDRVYTAPSINSRITRNGIIQGNFPQREIQYLVNTMSAGSLQAKLSDTPISQSVLAPELGEDNLRRGLEASVIALAAVAAFMIVYYFTSGVVAIVALACNGIIILGIMSLSRAAFTLPGIAGIVLTFGTAVDANVLIYERIREELRVGNDLRTSVRIAFNKVSSTIVDANVTNLIICFVLGFYGTQEIKGFGITLGIGVVATMFCSLVITRLIFTILVDRFDLQIVRHQLPIVVPLVDRILTPRINWMSMRYVFAGVSVVLVASSIGLIVMRGGTMLDTVFRGGTAITLKLKTLSGDEGQLTPLTMTRAQVQERVRNIADKAEAENDKILADLRDADVVPVNAQDDGVTSNLFTIRTTITDKDPLLAALVDAFGDVVESRPALRFVGADIQSVEGAGAPVFPVVGPRLGESIGRDDVTNDASRFIGGVAIVLDFAGPDLPRKDNLKARIEYMRRDPTFSGSALKRPYELTVIDGTDQAVQTAVLIVHDRNVDFFADQDRWRTRLAQDEWNLARAALTTPTILASVNSFSAGVAQNFRANAIFAVFLSFTLILIYVWVRFGSVRYSVAAILPLIHDVIIAVGFIALAEILYEHAPGMAAIGIRPFKIDMGMVAAIMAIIGYSLNDTIVILDRIRENRGKLVHASKDVINRSINQTFSRTLITTGTTVSSLLVLFFLGGEGVASFSYALLCGMVVGTYSSIAIASPIVFDPRVPPAGSVHHTPDAVRDEANGRFLEGETA